MKSYKLSNTQRYILDFMTEGWKLVGTDDKKHYVLIMEFEEPQPIPATSIRVMLRDGLILKEKESYKINKEYIWI